MKKRHIDDIWQRALKTFVQAFLGILIPEVVSLLQTGMPETGKIWYVLFPVLCSALASGISAGWNLLNNVLFEEEEEDERTDNTRNS